MFEQEYGERQEPHTEITLSNVALLGIFFGLLVVCGICFGFGYSIGKKRAEPKLAPPPVAITPSEPRAAPAAPTTARSAPRPAVTATPTVAPSTPHTVQAAKPTPAPPDASQAQQPAEPSAPTPLLHGYAVQVASIAQQADAQALATALRGKGFPAESKQGADRMYHVQLGPFASQKDAAAQRDKLVDDGYMAVIKQQ